VNLYIVYNGNITPKIIREIPMHSSAFSDYFSSPSSISQKKYEALRAFYYEKRSAQEVAKTFGYTLNAFYSLAHDFRQFIHERENREDLFFFIHKPGRKEKAKKEELDQRIIDLRKQYLSVPDIKSALDSQDYRVSE